MKKHILAFVMMLAISSAFTNSVCPVQAATVKAPITGVTEEKTVDYDENGNYEVITVKTLPQLPTTMYSTYSTNSTVSKTGIAVLDYFNSKDELCWEYVLTGYFTVNKGVSSKCTKATAQLDIFKSAWDYKKESRSISGNSVTGKITVTKGLLVKTRSITLICNKYGNFSIER